ncbi:cuscuta receptor 1-like [Populus nigra]|uniref:cuscuta receptor 1-like n=1 Tax=Populus nigra TaxID=3691 RepID=UPI002B276830|nr:cuscuta receptor 1-like [Populus nigra]
MILNSFSLPGVAVIMMINVMLLSQGCFEEERIALLQIKTSFGDHPNDNLPPLFYWGKDALCCSWEGVTCSNSTTRRVIEIDLFFARDWYSSMGDWYLNASIFLPFQELKVLDLGANRIAGCVANEGFERLSRLNKLETLYLSFNNFNNSILSSLKGLLSLKHLHLDANQLKGSINTKEFDSLSNLEVLSLSYNNIQEFTTLRGSEGPSRLNKLQSLDLSFNNFNNSILSSLEGLNKLESLDLRYNHFNNSILSSLKELSSLKHLNLGDNQLQGSINMKEFDSLSNLEELSLSGNNIQNFVALTGIN